MPKYYCDYCKAYLTHDTLSVRKSHLMGKNHIRYYCNYYEAKAKETGIWDPNESAYEINLSYLNSGAPGSDSSESKQRNSYEQFCLPPPPHVQGLPNPPPSVLCNSQEYKKSIQSHMKRQNNEFSK